MPGVVIGAALVGGCQLEVDGGPVAVGEVLAGDGAGEVVHVTDVVEPAERAFELPEPGVVTHPVGAEMDQPGLAHAAVVVGGRVPGVAGPFGIPVHPLHHVGHALVVEMEEPGDPPAVRDAEREGFDVVEAHAHPDVPAHHVGDGHRTLHQRPDRVALVDVLPEPRGSAPRRVYAAVLGVELGDLLVGPRAQARWRRTSSSPAPSCVPCGSSAGTGPTRWCRRRRGTRSPTTRAPPDPRTPTACRAPPPSRCGATPDDRAATAPTTPAPTGAVERVHAPQRVTLHQVALVVGDRGDLVLTDQ